MGCQCSKIPASVKIIRVGENDAGIIDLDKIIKDVFFRKLRDEASLKEELLRKAREKNWIPDDRKEVYAEALLREYLLYAQSHQPPQQLGKKAVGEVGRFRRWFMKLWHGG